MTAAQAGVLGAAYALLQALGVLAAGRAMRQRMEAGLRRRRLLTATRYTRDVPFERLAKLPFTGGNAATLLVDGAATFGSIFAGVAAAREYVLVQFYILRDDRLGRELQARPLERAAADLRARPAWFRFAVRLARLSAPVQ